ncbi:stimulated by retinoic acid gene 6 protein-like isoform X2 [Acanthaster planci]|uniref:Stimulated by retinoic acid gene 6 protein-like isoform X2 n=1 Tax=Acanthaster planci TaxID=133434 RepID=A0A8B7YPY4_ACAPL|nr:stimulated by retinoic acid gene 6 protein-like isoform X2 [Acanthaster planci]
MGLMSQPPVGLEAETFVAPPMTRFRHDNDVRTCTFAGVNASRGWLGRSVDVWYTMGTRTCTCTYVHCTIRWKRNLFPNIILRASDVAVCACVEKSGDWKSRKNRHRVHTGLRNERAALYMMDEPFDFGESATQTSVFTTAIPVSPICTYFVQRVWMLYSLIPAVAVLALFCFLEKRVHLWQSCCQGRPGVAFPVNLVDSYSDRWSFAFAFGSMATSMVDGIFGKQNILLGNYDYEKLAVMLRGTVKFLVTIVNALIISVAFYPILLCLRSKTTLGNILGLVYSSSWFTFYIMSVALRCDIEEDDGAVYDIIKELGINGSGMVCFLALMIRFTLGIIQDIRRHLRKSSNASLAEKDFKMTHFYRRVKFLLTPPLPEEESRNILERLFRYVFGTSVPGFRFSRHSICTLVLTLITTIQVALVWISMCAPYLKDETDEALIYAFWITCAVSLLVTCIFTIDAQRNYRKHTVMLWRGDRSFFPQKKAKFDAMLVSSLRYSGYQVAFTAWGFLVLQVVLCAIAYLVIQFKEQVVYEIKEFWLTIFITVGFYYVQIILSRLLFLQRAPDRGQSRFVQRKDIYLGLDNRRIFHVTMYITLFINFLVGLLSCFFRIVEAIILETIFIGRLDHCILMRNWELWDQAFRSYMGFLELEVAHTHPVVITFCHFMLQNVHKRQSIMQNDEVPLIVNTSGGADDDECILGEVSVPPKLASASLKSRQVRNKWLVALTLSRNPRLALERKIALLADQQRLRTLSLNVSVRGSLL